MDKSSEYKQKGRLIYVEPGYWARTEGGKDDFIPYPYEDYNMAIDLQVKIADRYSCGIAGSGNNMRVLEFSSTNGSISFLGGTETDGGKYLTTNYTDISSVGNGGATSECLGIKSINICYNSWLYPQVTINFVDVRGATVMQPAEKAYYNEKDAGMSSQFYKALYSFPYPIFILKVKGFYGKGVTYQLAVQHTSMDFDAASGNFNITVKLIGYMFGIYADIPMSYIMTAPYMENGDAYWKSKIKSGEFRFLDVNGNPSSDMLKLPDLMMKLATAANSQEATSAAAERQKTSDNYDERSKSITSLSDAYPLKDWYECNDNDYLYKIGKSSDDYTTKRIKEQTAEFVNALSAYDFTYGTTFLSDFNGIAKAQERGFEIDSVEYIKEKNNATGDSKVKDTFWNKNENKYEKYIKGRPDVIRYIQDNGIEHFYVFVFPKDAGDVRYSDAMEKRVEAELKKIKEKKEQDEAILKEAEIQVYEKAIGFRPSIKNIYDLVFAHMDTFMNCFYGRMNNIKHQLDTEKEKRSKSFYGLIDGDTDTEKSSSPSGRGAYLPPFADFYKNSYSNGVCKRDKRWPGEVTNGDALEEVQFVKEMLASGQIYADTMSSVMEEIERMSSGETKTDGSFIDGTPSTSVGQFIPMTTYDFINKDFIGNPYMSLKPKAIKDEDIEGDVIGTFAIRAFYYLCTNSTENSSEAYSFGRLEGINFYKAVGDNVSKAFLSFINKYADGSNKWKDTNRFIKLITEVGSSDAATSAWQFEGANTNKNLFNKYNGNLTYNLYKKSASGYTFMPVGITNFNTVKDCFSKGENDLKTDREYITTTNFKDINFINDSTFNVGQLMNGGSFVVYEARDYIKVLYDNLDAEIKSAEETISKQRSGYGERKQGEFGDLKRTNRTLRKYKDNIESKFDEKAYVSGIIVDGKESSKWSSTVRDIIANGDLNTQSSYYIKYPSMIDEEKDSSIFDGDECYRMQKDIKAKAFLFLQSLPVKGKNGGIEEESDNGLSLKARLLREGSYYWREDNQSAVKIPDGYKAPSVDETFCGDKWADGYETYHLIKLGSYPKWKSPNGTTEARKKYLKAYFENWATSTNDDGFAANEKRLMNNSLYINGKKSKGLNIKELAADTSKESDLARESRQLQKFLRNLMFTICTTLDYYNGVSGDEFKCSSTALSDAFKGFMQELYAIYGEVVEGLNEKNSDVLTTALANEANNPFKSTDLRLSLYITLKALYDKWLCTRYNGENTWKLTRNPNSKSDFDNFIYIDSYYNDIGCLLPVNITKVASWLSSCLPTSNLQTTESTMRYEGKSVYQFLTETAEDTNAILLALPQKFGGKDAESFKSMFTPYSINSNWDDDSSSFIFMYSYPPSTHLGDTETANIDMNGYSPEGDGYNLTDDDIVGELFGGDHGYTVPSFGVTYAKQNQSFFKNIGLHSDNNGVTEASIAATQDIASKGSQSPRETTLYGQDLYRVYSQMSYQCEVEMMGNMQVMPLMYFQLNNIPLWKGAYLIKKVTHEISAGNINTKFEGVRQNRFALPIVEGMVITSNPPTTEGERNGLSIEGNGQQPTTGGNGQPDITGNSKLTIKDTIDFNEGNVTPQKPIICLTPAHGPKTQKVQEWTWSSKMIDSYLIPILQKMKYKDGTPLNIQRCNKGGNHTGKGYSTEETRNIIKKYGSDKVISVVPHWNGCAQNYHGTFINKVSVGTRADSQKFAEIMKECVNAVAAQRDTFTTLPEKAMDGVKYNRILPLGEDNSDGAPNLSCACILTENWFADYPKGSQWADDSKYAEMAGGRYKTMRGWLMNDGCKIVAQMHADAIKKYIDSLS